MNPFSTRTENIRFLCRVKYKQTKQRHNVRERDAQPEMSDTVPTVAPPAV